jgi:signal transduction histidine kinase/ActR/RegA family two-component response regulator
VAARCEAASFSSSDCEFLRQLSEHAALAAHQAQLYAALQTAYEELRQTQQAVMQQERLRALGQMASGIAHDINNALSPAALYVQSLLDHDESLGAQARSQLNITQSAIENVAGTIARMREFYRPREPQLILAPVDLNVMVQRVIDLTHARWSNIPQERGILIDLRKELGASLPPVLGAESEIRDALTNLLLNAVDAMPNGGTLTLRTRAYSGEIVASPAVCVEVCDTGIGMSEAVRGRCLEPFFTTKGEQGTGLGLAMVYGMVQRHGADLEIDSEPGAGTTVRLVFSAAQTSAPSTQLTDKPPARNLRVLIVDDDPLLLSSLQATLALDGHDIQVAEGGQEGIDVFSEAQQGAAPFDVVVTDLGMPHIDGRAVAAAVKSLTPAMPVILLTGWGYRLQAENDVPEHVDRVLSKPPKPGELRAALADVTRMGARRPQESPGEFVLDSVGSPVSPHQQG